MSVGARWFSAVIAILAVGTAMAGEPPLRLSDDGTAFLYQAQPGDLPGAVAERFGVRDVPQFLAANGIKDPTRVATGHVYRITNPLADRAFAAEARVETLAHEAEAAGTRTRALEAEVATLTAKADDLERRSAALSHLARLWPWAQGLGVVLVLGIGAAAYVAYRSMGELRQAERYTRQLAEDLDERRRGALAERQASARRILHLEDQARALELEVARSAAHRRPTGTH